MASNPQTVDVIQVRAEYEPAGGTGMAGGQVDTINVFNSINSIPYMEIGVQPGNSKTQVLAMSDAMQVETMAALQRFAFSSRDEMASVSVQLTAGYKESGQDITSEAVFWGMPVAPSKSAGFGIVNQSIKLYGGEIYYNSFRPYIYGPLPCESNNNRAEGAKKEDSDSSNIMQRAYDLLMKRVDMFKQVTISGAFNSQATYAMAKQVHNINLKQLPRIKALAESSTEALYESFDGLKTLDDGEYNQIKAAINDAILNMLLTSSGNFFDTLTGFLNAFQLYYVPDKTGLGYGAVRPFRTMVLNDNLVRKKIDTQYLSFSAEDYDYGPIQQVLVQGVFQTDRANAVKEEEARAASSIVPELRANTIFVWPESASVINGNFRPVGPPMWLPTSLRMFSRYEHKEAVEESGGWTISDYTKEQTKINTSIDRVLMEQYLAIIKEYAHNVFSQSALAAYTAVVRVPLDFSWEVGTRYEVVSQSGSVLFAGFLTQMNHNISGIRNSLSAWTTLVFSHVEYGDFELDLN
jgi:hypothetical protein